MHTTFTIYWYLSSLYFGLLYLCGGLGHAPFDWHTGHTKSRGCNMRNNNNNNTQEEQTTKYKI